MIDKSRKYWHGDSADDIDEYLRLYSGVASIDVKPVLCHTCGSERFKIWVDEDEDAIQVECSECGFKKIILDCEDIWEDADPHAGICPECKSKDYNVRVGFVRRDNRSVKHVYIGNRCSKCGLLGSYLDWSIKYEPTNTMEKNI